MSSEDNPALGGELLLVLLKWPLTQWYSLAGPLKVPRDKLSWAYIVELVVVEGVLQGINAMLRFRPLGSGAERQNLLGKYQPLANTNVPAQEGGKKINWKLETLLR